MTDGEFMSSPADRSAAPATDGKVAGLAHVE
jgi:hypothetical protein